MTAVPLGDGWLAGRRAVPVNGKLTVTRVVENGTVTFGIPVAGRVL